MNYEKVFKLAISEYSKYLYNSDDICESQEQQMKLIDELADQVCVPTAFISAIARHDHLNILFSRKNNLPKRFIVRHSSNNNKKDYLVSNSNVPAELRKYDDSPIRDFDFLIEAGKQRIPVIII